MTADAANSITIRLVFDGAPLAGKTTAAYALGEALGVEAETPVGDVAGRTMWFDWMSYTGGRHEGKAIRVELVTVPGQRALNERRRHLLEWGDVVVFIADSSPEGFPDTVRQARDLAEDLERVGGRPIIHVANKRDLDGALPIEQMRSELGLSEEHALIEGVAKTGAGMRQAFIFAVRAALAEHDGATEITSAEQLLAEMQQAVPLATEGQHGASTESVPSATSNADVSENRPLDGAEESAPEAPLGEDAPAPIVLRGARLLPDGLPDTKGLVLDHQMWRVINDIAVAEGVCTFSPDDSDVVARLIDGGLVAGHIVDSDTDLDGTHGGEAAGSANVDADTAADDAATPVAASEVTAVDDAAEDTADDAGEEDRDALHGEDVVDALVGAAVNGSAMPSREVSNGASTLMAGTATLAPVAEPSPPQRRSDEELERYRALRELSRRLRGGL